MTDPERRFEWRSIVLIAFLPTLLFSIGEGAIIPLIPLAADNLGATLAIAGVVAAMVTLGELVGDIPSGVIVARIGERTAMIGAAGVAVAGLLVSLVASTPLVLGVGIFLVGLASAVFALARHAFLTSYVPLEFRARALSTLGGTFRLGYFVGPFLSAAVISVTGSVAAAFWIFVVGCAGAVVTLLALPDPEATFEAVRRSRKSLTAGERFVADEATGLGATLARNRGLLLRLGSGSALIAALRAGRQVVLPLWAVSIGLPEAETAIIIGIAGAVDFALFYTGGQIMDRFGRLWTAAPSVIGLGVGHLALAFTHDLLTREGWFIALAIFLSLANGIGAGILMTLGADLAPPGNPAPFLGAWRFTNDSGGAAAPLLIAGLTAVASLPLAVGVLGVLGFVGAGALIRYLPRYSPRT
ncbi:MAG: transporter [Naasia sp.]|jgi:MFS family permease|uniref:MFS transporter n=1 Tax=Naasia sp. TaxID=2546198 RepID=UPI002627FA83|nr:MFS transporter [Naasia sp.]MCU1571546.1 transporter [Naasia sp.]